MKKLLLIALAALIGASALAQDGKSIYNKYSEAEGVSAVYISPAMFKLMKRIPDIDLEGENINLGPIIQNLTGMYLINSENPSINDDIKRDVDRFIRRGDYEMLLEAKEDGDVTRIYTMGPEEIVTGFVMLTYEPAECSFICINGEIPRAALEELLN
jgi:hypothetical protein